VVDALKVGLVGAGGIAHPHVAAWLQLGADVRVFSLDGQAGFAAQYGIAQAYSLAELIDASEVIDVCVPTFAHDEVVRAAAAAGRHVVCEKPLSLTHTGARAMIDGCRTAGVQLYPGQVVRYFPQYAAARDAVAAGHIGAPAVLRLSRRGAAPVSGWFADPGRSGGLVVDQMIHDLDFARWIAGDVTAVYAKVIARGRVVTAYAVLTHESGALSHVTGGWGPPHTVFTTAFTISGSHGQLRHSSAARPSLRWDVPALGDRGGTLLPDDFAPPFVAELREFGAAFRGGPAPRVTAEDSLAALDIALAAVESASSGRPVNPKDAAR
jgi:myo-inositol 2-dehydrogenase / D-chiro-inositol 1-dehydrogenase